MKYIRKIVILAFVVLTLFGTLTTRYVILSNDTTSGESAQKDEIAWRMRGPLTTATSELLGVVRDQFLEPPSTRPYKLRYENMAKSSYKELYPSWVLINSYLEDLFTGVREKRGFFVEAGALDGEYMSNTLRLEKEFGWTGLLVEPDIDSYKQLQKTNRKAWLTPTCLAIERYPHTAILKRIREVDDHPDWLRRGNSALMKDEGDTSASEDRKFTIQYSRAQCLPAHFLLLALNVSHVDFFSLDIENVEVDVLKNFPFDEITVDLWVIEHRISNHTELRYPPHAAFSLTEIQQNSLFSTADIKTRKRILCNIEDVNFVQFMQSKGYYLLDNLCTYASDYIFLRKKSLLYKKLDIPGTFENRTGVCKDKIILVSQTTFNKKMIRDPHHFPEIQYHEPLSSTK